MALMAEAKIRSLLPSFSATGSILPLAVLEVFSAKLLDQIGKFITKL
jgi:hypothetical protein